MVPGRGDSRVGFSLRRPSGRLLRVKVVNADSGVGFSLRGTFSPAVAKRFPARRGGTEDPAQALEKPKHTLSGTTTTYCRVGFSLRRPSGRPVGTVCIARGSRPEG